MLDWLQSDAAYWTISITLLAVGSLLLLRGVIGRRSRGRPLCRKCDYDLTGGVSGDGTGINLTCPECGHTHRKPRSPYQPRRYWKRAAIGLCMALLAAYALFWPGITQRREKLDEKWYLAVVPTTGWIWLVPYLNKEQIDLLDRRFYGEEWKRAISAGGSGGPMWDGTTQIQVFFETWETRAPRTVPYLSDWQKRLLSRRCLVALAEPIPPREVRESHDEATGEAIYRQAYRRELACNWLGGFMDVSPEARQALFDVINSSVPLGGERRVALKAFQLVNEPAAEDFALMLAAMRDDDKYLNEIATETLARWGKAEPTVVKALIESIREQRGGGWLLSQLRPVSQEMVDVLHAELMAGRDDGHWYSIAGLGEAAVPRLIDSLLSIAEPDHLNPNLQTDERHWDVAGVLSDIGEPAVAALVTLLDHPDKRIVDRAMFTLNLMDKRGAAAIPALKRMLEQTTDEDERGDIESTIRSLTEGSIFDRMGK